MVTTDRNDSFRDVTRYPSDILKPLDQGVLVCVTYNKVWDDGFGARGWKLNATIGDPAIIASTRQTGQRINTSVFVHDILDHLLSGFGVSGHRSEAMALAQLAKRTGSDPGPDYRQMVNEDIMHGRINGESLSRFLPDSMLSVLPAAAAMTDKEVMAYLRNTVGVEALIGALVDHFFCLGAKGADHAVDSWQKLGLNPDKATDMGLALQALLERVDAEAESTGIDRLDASIVLNNEACVFIAKPNSADFSGSVYHKTIAS